MLHGSTVSTAIDAEQDILAHFLGRPSDIGLLPGLGNHQFADPLHSRIYSAISGLRSMELPVTPESLTAYLIGEEASHGIDDASCLDAVGGVQYLHELKARNCADLHGAINQVRDAWIRRQLLDIGETLTRATHEGAGRPALCETLSRMQRLAAMVQS